MKKYNYNRNTLLLVSAISCAAIYAGYSYVQLFLENTDLQQTLTQRDELLKNLTDTVSKALKEKADLATALEDAASKNQDFANQLNQVNHTVYKLEQLSAVDPQLLQKYSKVFFLNENYIPRDLSPIDQMYLADKNKPLQIYSPVLPFLENMLHAASQENIQMVIVSAYRSFGTQANLKSRYKVTYGIGANSFSAEQGYSEHQLGTAVDISTPSIGSGLTGFQHTAAYTWLQNNAYKFGFSLSYPEHNAYYIFEPWHWRFVGPQLALKLHNENKNFYDLDQREINNYLGTFLISTSTNQSL